MNYSSYEFIMNNDLKIDPESFAVFNEFVHRTFNKPDLWHLQHFYKIIFYKKASRVLETAFTKWLLPGAKTVEMHSLDFFNIFLGLMRGQVKKNNAINILQAHLKYLLR